MYDRVLLGARMRRVFGQRHFIAASVLEVLEVQEHNAGNEKRDAEHQSDHAAPIHPTIRAHHRRLRQRAYLSARQRRRDLVQRFLSGVRRRHDANDVRVHASKERVRRSALTTADARNAQRPNQQLFLFVAPIVRCLRVEGGGWGCTGTVLPRLCPTLFLGNEFRDQAEPFHRHLDCLQCVEVLVLDQVVGSLQPCYLQQVRRIRINSTTKTQV